MYEGASLKHRDLEGIADSLSRQTNAIAEGTTWQLPILVGASWASQSRRGVERNSEFSQQRGAVGIDGDEYIGHVPAPTRNGVQNQGAQKGVS
jgi:hypothetical protein